VLGDIISPTLHAAAIAPGEIVETGLVFVTRGIGAACCPSLLGLRKCSAAGIASKCQVCGLLLAGPWAVLWWIFTLSCCSDLCKGRCHDYGLFLGIRGGYLLI
jgi:hypothetical protein